MCSPCLCTLSASASIHPPIPTFGRFLLEIFLNFLFLLFFVMRCRPRTCSWCIILAHTPWQMASNCASTLCPTIEKRWSYVVVTLNTKLKMHTPRKFPGYWWLFRTQHLSRYSARLVEERRKKERKKKMNNSEFRPFQVCHFKIVTTHCYYYCRLGQTL